MSDAVVRDAFDDIGQRWVEVDKWETMGCGFCYVEAGQRCHTSSGKPRQRSHTRRLYWTLPDALAAARSVSLPEPPKGHNE